MYQAIRINQDGNIRHYNLKILVFDFFLNVEKLYVRACKSEHFVLCSAHSVSTSHILYRSHRYQEHFHVICRVVLFQFSDRKPNEAFKFI